MSTISRYESEYEGLSASDTDKVNQLWYLMRMFNSLLSEMDAGLPATLEMGAKSVGVTAEGPSQQMRIQSVNSFRELGDALTTAANNRSFGIEATGDEMILADVSWVLSKAIGKALVKAVAKNVGASATKQCLSNAAAGSITLMKNGDQFLINASKTAPMEGVLDVIAHGAPNIVEYGSMKVSHRFLSKLIRRNGQYTGQPIRLISCNTGKLADGFAQNLSNKLGVPVISPNNFVWAWPNGKLTIGETMFDNSGKWIQFLPRGVRP